MNVAAPSFGVSAAPESTIRAPSGPPIQFHQGAPRIAASAGGAGCTSAITIRAVAIVPRIEKKAAYRGSCRLIRSPALAEACRAMHAPAPIASTNHTISISL